MNQFYTCQTNNEKINYINEKHYFINNKKHSIKSDSNHNKIQYVASITFNKIILSKTAR